MPIGEPHRTQKRKNIALLLILLALVALMYAVSMMKMSGAS